MRIMKAKRRLWLMVAMMLSVVFVSCSDEKEEPKEDPNQPVVGENFDIFTSTSTLLESVNNEPSSSENSFSKKFKSFQ